MSCIIKVCNGVSRNYMLAFFKLMLGAYGVCHNSFCIINVHTNVTLPVGIDHLQFRIFLLHFWIRLCHGCHVGVHKCIAAIERKHFSHCCTRTQVAILTKFAYLQHTLM